METKEEIEICISDRIRIQKEDHQCAGYYHWSWPDYQKARDFFEWLRKENLKDERTKVL